MNNKTEILSKIKHLIYKVCLPVYLWSIGYKTLENYIDDLEEQHLHSLATSPIAEIKTDDEEKLWVRIDDHLPQKGSIRLINLPH